jgi:hypothetical protein
VAVGVIVGVVVGAADADADAVSVGLAAGNRDGEPLAVTPTQPVATRAVSTSAAPLRQLRLLKNDDFTDCPSGRSLMRNASVTPLWAAV